MYILTEGTEAQFIWGQWTVPVVISEMGNDWVSLRYPLEEPIGPGIYVDLQVQYDLFKMTYYYFTLNIPRQFNDILFLRRAASRTYIERRQAWRVIANEPVRMEYGENRIAFEATLLDISSTGAYFAVEHLLPLSNPLRIYLPMNGQIYMFNGVIVRKIPPVPRLGIPLRMGVRFVNNPIELRNKLVYYLWSRIREIYRDQIKDLYPGITKRPKKKFQKLSNSINDNPENKNNEP